MYCITLCCNRASELHIYSPTDTKHNPTQTSDNMKPLLILMTGFVHWPSEGFLSLIKLLLFIINQSCSLKYILYVLHNKMLNWWYYTLANNYDVARFQQQSSGHNFVPYHLVRWFRAKRKWSRSRDNFTTGRASSTGTCSGTIQMSGGPMRIKIYILKRLCLKI